MSPVSRGFGHFRRAPDGQEDRVPPGQYVTDGFPVLSAGPTPHTPCSTGRSPSPRPARPGSPGPGRNSGRCRPRPSRRTCTA